MSNEINSPVSAQSECENTQHPSSLSEVKQEQRVKSLKTYNKKKRKKIIKTIIIILIVIAILVFGAYKAGYLDKLLGKEDLSATAVTTYTLNEATAYRTITKVLTSTGTIEPNDQYTITALVSGEILSDHFEKGDTVIEDQLLYEIESDSLDSNVTRARNSLKTARTSLEEAYEKLEKLNVDSDITGTIQKLHVKAGDEINAGQLIADIIDKDTMSLEVPFLDDDCKNMSVGDKAKITFIDSPEQLEGTVDEISANTYVSGVGATIRNVKILVKNPGGITTSTFGLAEVGNAVCTSHGTFNYSDEGSVYAQISGDVVDIYYSEGSYITKGSILVKLKSTSLENQIESLEINVENAQTSLEDALDAYDNYNITSPISGTVISKNYKQGDTIGSGGSNNSSQLAVIYDMSALKFTMSIDELDIDSLEEGQEVIITSDSRQGSSYSGVISNISIQGTTTSGTTVYPIEVTIENVEDESKRTISKDGTVNKVYKTGMTSTENEYILTSTSVAGDASAYTYSDGTSVKRVNYTDGFDLYIDDIKLNKFTENSYILGTTVYTFTDSFDTMTVEVRNEKKMLRPGMNIDAEIIVEKRENVLAIPVTAVGRGNTVKVLKKKSQDNSADSSNVPISSAYGTADIDEEYETVTVSIGISDEEYVEIIDGLEIGDIIIIDSAQRSSYQNQMFGMMGMHTGMTGGMDSARPMGNMGSMGTSRPMSNMGNSMPR
ncbi:MAG: HlyD family efflux transporter periplasmic adaptor subunit [Clostridia bacterium]|nr:HlyD family efflux transporter periplasmic adaptor subunit [Clostridia bacterium]